MKTKYSSRNSNRSGVIASIGRNARCKARWILPAVVLTGLAVSFGVWSRAQNATAKAPAQVAPNAQDIEPPMTPERELARLAISDPVSFEKLARKVKTPKELQDEDISKFAIMQPRAYATEFEKFKTPERKHLEQQARAAILNPVAHSGPVPKKPNQQQPTQDSKR